MMMRTYWRVSIILVVITPIVFIKYQKSIRVCQLLSPFQVTFEKLHLFHCPLLNHLQPLLSLLKAEIPFETIWPGLPKAETLSCFHAFKSDLQHETVDEYRQKLHRLVNSQDQPAYERNRKATGLSKPSIVDGLLYSIPMPLCYSVDLMHLAINIGELQIPLWQGTLKCEQSDDKLTWDWVTSVIEHFSFQRFLNPGNL
ncbi:uncharacterized protein LACBIDRAFT_312311 [Laccaria bicolor S238N-H82]|uniref:Predicted protein n=1 Tax=Laccaria bicolor (strain S238N-H82 / ATCC MYA-4686) TaxID=486041 RepID=B0DVX8_LACBS|nr:uncharacterized protein LACBIDRAFT_312311 [Laccaria bicolor S238N-H82]EDR01213.1 predicted protein [Laccaria bicolor S238N-H82]|eukprot:XP_001888089.1 predicted protein [Laccaria bicolor S238N-H82]